MEPHTAGEASEPVEACPAGEKAPWLPLAFACGAGSYSNRCCHTGEGRCPISGPASSMLGQVKFFESLNQIQKSRLGDTLGTIVSGEQAQQFRHMPFDSGLRNTQGFSDFLV